MECGQGVGDGWGCGAHIKDGGYKATTAFFGAKKSARTATYGSRELRYESPTIENPWQIVHAIMTSKALAKGCFHT